MNVGEAVSMARRLVREHGLEGWVVKLDRAKTRAGVTKFATRTIGLSKPLTMLHDEAAVRDTILHEIAHALVGPRHGHDAVWRETAQRIGCSGERCVGPDQPRVEGEWVGVCSAGHRVTRHRRPLRVASCSRCARGFSIQHVFTWTKQGRAAPMHPRYLAEIERLTRRPKPAWSRPLGLGDMARILAPGRYKGLTGEVEYAGTHRFHIRVPDGVLAVSPEELEPVWVGGEERAG